MRAFFYIDGQNVYFGLKNLGVDPRSFNFRLYGEYLCRAIPEKHVPQKRVLSIKYYSARFPSEINREKHNRDDAYFQALTRYQNITVVEGRFRTEKVGNRLIPQEKGVDVRLATDLLVDAFHGAFDVAYVVSTDTDLLPAIHHVRKLFSDKKVYGCVFKNLPQFTQACNGLLKIHRPLAEKFIDHRIFPATDKTILALKDKYNLNIPTKDTLLPVPKMSSHLTKKIIKGI